MAVPIARLAGQPSELYVYARCARDEHPLLPLGERTGLWPGAVLSPEQSFEHSGIGARHLEYLHPASRSCHQRHEPWPTPNAAATEASAAAVALPSTARSLTRTTRAPSCSPPTPGRADPGRTRTAIRTAPVCPCTPCLRQVARHVTIARRLRAAMRLIGNQGYEGPLRPQARPRRAAAMHCFWPSGERARRSPTVFGGAYVTKRQ